MGKQLLDTDPKFDSTKPFLAVAKTEESTVDETIPSFDPKKPFNEVKKKEPTVAVVGPPKPSQELGLPDTSEPVKPVTEPSSSLTGSAVDPLGIGEVIAKTVYSGFAHQLPGAIATIPALNNQSYEDYLLNKESSATKGGIAGKLFAQSLMNFDIGKAFSVGDKEIKEEFLKTLKTTIGEEQYNKDKALYEADIVKSSLQGRLEYEKSSGGREALLAGIPESYTKIKNPKDAAQYLAYQLGQSLPTMAMAAVAPGLGSYILEATDSYNENVEETAKALGKTPHQVIEQSLDKPAKEIASNVGLINAALDVGGIGSIIGAARRLFVKDAAKEIAKKSLSSKLLNLLKDPLVIEPITETLQETNTAFSSQKAAGKSDEQAWNFVKENHPRLIDSFVGGLTGAGGAEVIVGKAKTTSQVIAQAKNQIKSSSDTPTIEAKAEEIIEAVKQTPVEGVVNDRTNIEGQIQSDLRKGEKPLETEPNQGRSDTQASANRMVQKSSETQEVAPPLPEATEGAKPIVKADEQIAKEGPAQAVTPEGSKGEGLPEQPSPASEQPQVIYGDHKERLIAENLAGIKREDFEKYGDKNKITKAVRLNYFRKEARPLDQQAQELSYQFNPNGDGNEISPQDIIDFINKHEETTPAGRRRNLRNDDKIANQAPVQTEETDYTQSHLPDIEEIKAIYEEPDHGNAPDLTDKQLDFYLKDEQFTPEKLEQAKKEGLFDGFPYSNDDFLGLKRYFDGQKGKISEGDRNDTRSPEEGSQTRASEAHQQEVISNEAAASTGSNALPDQQATPAEAPPATPPPTEGPTSTIPPGPAGEKQFAVARRIEASDANPAIKRGIKEQGDTYIPKGLNLTEQEAQNIIDHHGEEKAEAMLKDPSNGITPDTRVVIAGKLYETYSGKDNQKAVDIAIWAENFLMQAGRAANAGKFWKMITSTGEDQIVLAIERQQQAQAEGQLASIREGVSKSHDQIEAEIRRLVESKVQATVGERLEKAKLITKEKRKQIGDFFDSLKVDTKNNIMTASLLPIGVLPHVWNAAVDVIRTAVLTGADVANAIQAGIDYIKANQKEAFDEKRFRDEFTPQIEAIMPKENVNAKDINEEAVETPKLTGRKKTDFIHKVIDAYNEGKLTDKKFDELYASKLGVKELSAEDRNKIRELAKIVSDTEKFFDKIQKLPADQFTPEHEVAYKKLLERAQKANKLLQEYSQTPNDVFDTLIAIMQANLMSTMSLSANVFYNVAWQPVRFVNSGVASMLDYGISKLARLGLLPKTMRERTTIGPFSAKVQKAYFEGQWDGLVEGIKQIKTGTQSNEYALREIQSNFNPGKAVDRWADKDRSMAQKINDAIEGTVGYEAEAVFRVLNLGDKPFKRSAEFVRANELATLKGLTGKEKAKFLAFPDPEAQAEIIKAGQEATFQQASPEGKIIQDAMTKILNHISTFPLIGGPAKVILKSQIPYVKTPWNLVVQSIRMATPTVTFAVGAYQTAKGNKRTGTKLMGEGIVGTMIWGVATSLFLKGLMTGDDDKDKKKRDFQLGPASPPPNSINASALQRGLSGQGWEQKDDDTWVSYSKMGVVGICFDNYANIYKDRITQHGNISGGPESFITDQLASAPRVASSTIDQSFLQGTSTLLEAVKDGGERKTQTWLIKTLESVGSIAYPNTIATLGKASDEYLRDTEDPKFVERLKNVYKAKMFLGEQLPPKVNLWGEMVTGNPEGRNKYAYYLFDPSKFKNVDTDDYRFKLYQQFKKDYDSDWLPSMPQRKITVDGSHVSLTPTEFEQLCINVGQERSAQVSAYINSGEMDSAPDDATRKEELKMRYDEGYQLGKEKYMINHGISVPFKFRTPMEIRSLKRNINRLKKQ